MTVVKIEESRFNTGKADDKLEYTPLTSCMTLTVLTEDKRMIGGHFVVTKAKEVEGLIRGMKQALQNKKVTQMVLVGPEACWRAQNIPTFPKLQGVKMIKTALEILGELDYVYTADTPGKGEKPTFTVKENKLVVVNGVDNKAIALGKVDPEYL